MLLATLSYTTQMDIPKRSPSLFILIIFITTYSSNAGTNNNIPVPDGPSLPTYASNPYAKKTVQIINEIGSTISYHCKSKDDDFGERSLLVDSSWSFSFRRQIFGRSLFFCYFVLPNIGRYWFDIYKEPRDSSGEFWCNNCVWEIRSHGPCRHNKITNHFDLCYPWNKNKSL
ncbi:S-protein homolog 2-like [Raphanus sativus]|uniref:S-protein homolog n=1 Tax=Raphanus sativus TaxID=3726 RepID=A0A6J0KLS5_RAPSA|nr:S-protein homolog 2-like [Raphanus sativus]